MKILLVGNYAPDLQYSMLGFFKCLSEHLPTLGVPVQPVQPHPVIGTKPGPAKKWRGYWDKYVLFPRKLRALATEVDLVHVCDHSNAVYLRSIGDTRSVLTCHDLLPIRAALGQIPGWKVGPSGQRLQSWIRSSIGLADVVACVSSATLNDLQSVVDTKPGQARLLLNGMYLPKQELDDKRAIELNSRLGLADDLQYVLHIGGNTPYKNRNGLVGIYSELTKLPGFESMSLVMSGHRPLPDLERVINESSLRRNIIVLSGLSDEQHAALYSRAQAFLFPSTHEGFGLPIIEAQSYGCPVFTTGAEPMTEVGGEAAVYFDPDEPKLAARIIADSWLNRPTMIRAGLDNSSSFDTKTMVSRYVSLYEELK